MDKYELIRFLEPFDDEIEIVVRGAHKGLMGPLTYKLEYVGFTDDHPALIAINMMGSEAVDAGVSG